MSTVIETERLILRHYVSGDLDALCDVFADPYSNQFYPKMVERENVKGWIDWNLDNYRRFGFGLWAIELRNERRLIGDCGVTYQEVEGVQELEIGYHLHERERGHGYATEAARACLDFAFNNIHAESVCCIVDPDNVASQNVAKRLHRHTREFCQDGRTMLVFWTNRPGP